MEEQDDRKKRPPISSETSEVWDERLRAVGLTATPSRRFQTCGRVEV